MGDGVVRTVRPGGGVYRRPGRGANELNTPDGMDYVPLGVHEKPLWQLVHHP